MIDLIGKSTVKRRKAARLVLKLPSIDSETCSYLIQAIQIEVGTKNWMTQCVLFEAIGKFKCRDAILTVHDSYLQGADNYSTSVTSAARCFVRLSRDNINDAKPIFKLLEFDNFSITMGALDALGYDRMIPELEAQKQIIEHCYDIGNNLPRGLADPRYGLAASCAGWNIEIVSEFLKDCIKTDDVPLQYVAKNSLASRYVKLR